MSSQTYDRISEEVKSAMKGGDTLKRDCLRSVMSDIKNATVNAGKDLTEEAVVKCLKKAVKQRDDSVECFKAGGREDLALKEVEERQILKSFLPAEMTETEIEAAVDKAIAELQLDFQNAVGKCMGAVMKALPAAADKAYAAKYLKSVIAKGGK